MALKAVLVQKSIFWGLTLSGSPKLCSPAKGRWKGLQDLGDSVGGAGSFNSPINSDKNKC